MSVQLHFRRPAFKEILNGSRLTFPVVLDARGQALALILSQLPG